MIQKVLSFVKQYHMIAQGDHILAGVSGGADSVCLLLVLDGLRKQYGCRITVVHVEHGIRGEASIKDAEFVKNLCEDLGVECRVFHCDAVAFSKENGMSLEEGARVLRYDYFEQTRAAVAANKIAVAHNQNDSAETLLFHLARGTGLKGMCGISPVRGNIIRPLLCVERREIEEYLAKRGQEYCTDATNQETEYSRNKIRHQVLPVLSEINSQAVAHLYRSTEYLAEAVELMEGLVQQAREACVEAYPKLSEITNGFFIKEVLCTQPGLIQKTLILKLLGECAGSEKDLSDIHVMQVLKLFAGQVDKYVMLPYGMEARRSYEGVIIRKVPRKSGKEKKVNGGNPTETEMGLSPQPVMDGSKLELRGHDWYMTARILEKDGDFHEIPKKTYTKWFDYDKIRGTLLLRTRCQGDFFVLDAQGSRQSLKKYFINEKVPARERDSIPVLADGEHVLWAVGYRISEAYKVTADTKRILEIQVNGGNIYE